MTVELKNSYFENEDKKNSNSSSYHLIKNESDHNLVKLFTEK